MDTDFQPLIENQVKIVAKIQNMALIDLSEKNSEMLENHLNLLFNLCDLCIAYDDDDDDGEDEPSKKPTPTIDDAKY